MGQLIVRALFPYSFHFNLRVESHCKEVKGMQGDTGYSTIHSVFDAEVEEPCHSLEIFFDLL